MALGGLAAGQAEALTFTLANSFSCGGSSYRTYSVDVGISWAQARTFAQGLGGGAATLFRSIAQRKILQYSVK